MYLKHDRSVRRIVEVGDGFWMDRSRRGTSRSGGEHGGCRSTGTQQARSGCTGPVSPTASDGLGVDVGSILGLLFHAKSLTPQF